MARSKISVRKEIEIERNFIEKKLMDVSAFMKRHRKAFIVGFASFFAIVILLIAALAYLENASEEEKVKFYTIVEEYNTNAAQDDDKNTEKAIKELKELVDSTYFGFVHEMSHYMLGNIYFEKKEYKKAEEYLLKFADKTSSVMFAGIALQKAAISAEESNNIDKALDIYKNLEAEYSDSAIADQVYYNQGRIYAKKGDVVTAKSYFNKLISSYPQSLLTQKAKKLLFLVGYKK